MTDSEKLVQIAERMPEVYNAGQKSEYDRFWDAYQDNGNRRNYANGFVREGWRSENFKPKYPIIATGDASYMFDGSRIGNWDTPDFDFVERGIELDVRGATSLTYMFRNCHGIKRVGVIDGTGCKDLNRLFYTSGIDTIDELRLAENVTFDNTFASANLLKNITISGEIGNSINFLQSPLTPESMISVITHLQYTSDLGVKTVYFSDSCWAALESSGIENPIPDICSSWKQYVSYLGWSY